MSLTKRLKREAQANPGKAIGLGVLLIVAGYFWAPLIKGYIASAPTATEPPSSAASAPATPSPAPTPSTAPPKMPESPVYDWQKYAQLMDEDVKMRTAVELPSDRDPFKAQQVGPAEVSAPITAEEAPKVAEAPPLDPRDAGLVLSSTFVGPRKQVALIGGKPYHIGDRVRAKKDGMKASFKVVDVQPRLIVLERNGKQYELTITRAHSNTQEVLTSAESDDESDEDESPDGEMTPDVPAAKK
jgi:hypothetical protein